MCGKSNREEISGETGVITYPMWHLIILDELDDNVNDETVATATGNQKNVWIELIVHLLHI